EEDAVPATDYGLLVAQRLPRQADAWPEIIPVGIVGGRAPSANAGELHYTRGSGNGINRVRIEAVHLAVRVGHWGIGLPSHPDIQCKRAADGPVVLRESREVPALTI